MWFLLRTDSIVYAQALSTPVRAQDDGKQEPLGRESWRKPRLPSAIDIDQLIDFLFGLEPIARHELPPLVLELHEEYLSDYACAFDAAMDGFMAVAIENAKIDQFAEGWGIRMEKQSRALLSGFDDLKALDDLFLRQVYERLESLEIEPALARGVAVDRRVCSVWAPFIGGYGKEGKIDLWLLAVEDESVRSAFVQDDSILRRYSNDRALAYLRCANHDRYYVKTRMLEIAQRSSTDELEQALEALDSESAPYHRAIVEVNRQFYWTIMNQLGEEEAYILHRLYTDAAFSTTKFSDSKEIVRHIEDLVAAEGVGRTSEELRRLLQITKAKLMRLEQEWMRLYTCDHQSEMNDRYRRAVAAGQTPQDANRSAMQYRKSVTNAFGEIAFACNEARTSCERIASGM